MAYVEPAQFRQAALAALEGKKAIRDGDMLLSIWVIACEVAGWHQPMPDDLCRDLRLPQRSSYAAGGRRIVKILLGKK
jgi:hypothetical protein